MTDFDTWERMIRRAYADDPTRYKWPVEDQVATFKLFHEQYQEIRGEDPPHMRQETLEKVMQDLEDGYSAKDYEELDYFSRYLRRNYKAKTPSLSHFVSGQVREMLDLELTTAKPDPRREALDKLARLSGSLLWGVIPDDRLTNAALLKVASSIEGLAVKCGQTETAYEIAGVIDDLQQ